VNEDADRALDRAESSLASGGKLRGTGFWTAVDRLRADPDLASAFADRVAVIDRRAFEAGVRLRAPAWAGVLGLLAVTAAGIALVVEAARLNPLPASIVLLVATGALLVGTHSLTHWLVGRLLGIRFTHVFLGGPPPPRPGMKVDYASYLRTRPLARAVMHASGAVVTKVVPFAMLAVGAAIDVQPWCLILLAVIGVVQVVTDAVLSTKTSDWKKVKRELAAARVLRGR
jgi:hypothetical protein